MKARWERKNKNTIDDYTTQKNTIEDNKPLSVSVSDSVSVSVSDSVSDSDKDNNLNIYKGVKGKKKAQAPPTLEQIREYVKEKNLNVDPEQFFNYFDAGNWIDATGQKVRSWKQKLLTWNKYDSQKPKEKKDNKNKFVNFEERQHDSDYYKNLENLMRRN